MTRSRWIGLALVSAPLLAWLIYGIALYGWIVPVAVYTGVGAMVAGLVMLVRSDKRA